MPNVIQRTKVVREKKWKAACRAIRRTPKLLIMFTVHSTQMLRAISISLSKKRKRGTHREEITPVTFSLLRSCSEKEGECNHFRHEYFQRRVFCWSDNKIVSFVKFRKMSNIKIELRKCDTKNNKSRVHFDRFASLYYRKWNVYIRWHPHRNVS